MRERPPKSYSLKDLVIGDAIVHGRLDEEKREEEMEERMVEEEAVLE